VSGCHPSRRVDARNPLNRILGSRYCSNFVEIPSKSWVKICDSLDRWPRKHQSQDDVRQWVCGFQNSAARWQVTSRSSSRYWVAEHRPLQVCFIMPVSAMDISKLKAAYRFPLSNSGYEPSRLCVVGLDLHIRVGYYSIQRSSFSISWYGRSIHLLFILPSRSGRVFRPPLARGA